MRFSSGRKRRAAWLLAVLAAGAALAVIRDALGADPTGQHIVLLYGLAALLLGVIFEDSFILLGLTLAAPLVPLGLSGEAHPVEELIPFTVFAAVVGVLLAGVMWLSHRATEAFRHPGGKIGRH